MAGRMRHERRLAVAAFLLLGLLAGVAAAQEARNGNDPLPVSTLWVLNPDDGELKPLAKDMRHTGAPCWSPDGERIAFHAWSGTNWNIYTCRADGEEVEVLIDGPSDDFSPAWSPDGQRLAFASNCEGYSFIFLADAETGAVTRLTYPVDDRFYHDDPVWHPDGQTITFLAHIDGAVLPRLYAIPADGGDAVLISAPYKTASGATWVSSNTLAFVANPMSDEPGAFCTLDWESRKLAEPVKEETLGGKLFGHAAQRPGSSEIVLDALGSGQNGNINLFLYEPDTGIVKHLTGRTTGAGLTGYQEPAWSPDGKTLACVLYETTGRTLMRWLSRAAFRRRVEDFRRNRLGCCDLGYQGEFIFTASRHTATPPTGMEVYRAGDGVEVRAGYGALETYARVSPSGVIELCGGALQDEQLTALPKRWPLDEKGKLIPMPEPGTVLYTDTSGGSLDLTPPEGTVGWAYRNRGGDFCGSGAGMKPFPDVFWIVRTEEGFDIRHSGPKHQGVLFRVRADGDVFYGDAGRAPGAFVGKWTFADDDRHIVCIPGGSTWNVGREHRFTTTVHKDGRVSILNPDLLDIITPEEWDEMERMAQQELSGAH